MARRRTSQPSTFPLSFSYHDESVRSRRREVLSEDVVSAAKTGCSVRALDAKGSRSLPLSRIDFLPPECVARAALLSRRL